MGSDYKEELIKNKYAEIPDIPTYRKKSKKLRPKKANHKHDYQLCIVEYPQPRFPDKELIRVSSIASYCTICGKLDYYDESRDRWNFECYDKFGNKIRPSSFFVEREKLVDKYSEVLPKFSIDTEYGIFNNGQQFVDLSKAVYPN